MKKVYYKDDDKNFYYPNKPDYQETDNFSMIGKDGTSYRTIRYQKRVDHGRVAKFLKALGYTLITFGFGLLKEKTRNRFEQAFSGKKVVEIKYPMPLFHSNFEESTSVVMNKLKGHKIYFETVLILFYDSKTGHIDFKEGEGKLEPVVNEFDPEKTLLIFYPKDGRSLKPPNIDFEDLKKRQPNLKEIDKVLKVHVVNDVSDFPSKDLLELLKSKRFEKLRKEIEDVKNAMTQNLDQLLQRGEKVEKLVDGMDKD